MTLKHFCTELFNFLQTLFFISMHTQLLFKYSHACQCAIVEKVAAIGKLIIQSITLLVIFHDVRDLYHINYVIVLSYFNSKI